MKRVRKKQRGRKKWEEDEPGEGRRRKKKKKEGWRKEEGRKKKGNLYMNCHSRNYFSVCDKLLSKGLIYTVIIIRIQTM